MGKKLKRFLALLLATCMMMNTVSISSTAGSWQDTTLAPSEGKFPKSKTAEGWIDDEYVDVTLNVGGDSEDMSSDIVFIIGNGPASNYGYILDMIHRMLIAIDGTPTKIKIGMVGFADTTEAENVLPLTEMKDVVAGNQVADYRIEGRYNDGNQYTESLADYQARKAAAFAGWEAENPLLHQDMDYIIAKGLERAEDVYSGINLESALITARDMLIADDTVPADRKHMIAISTGLTYWFDNDAGEPVTIIGTNKFGTYMHGNKYWLQARDASTNTSAGYYMKGWMVVNDDNGQPDYQASWNRYWNMIVGWIAADQDSYVYNPGKTYSEFYYNGNSTEIRPENNANYRYGSAIQNPEDIAKVTGAVPFFAGGANPATTPNAAHALNYERAQYESWVVYKQMETPIGESFTTVLGDTVEGLGFNCYSIANGVSSNPGEEDRWLASNQIGYNFMHMLGGENTVNYREGDNTFFAPIENKILHRLSSGSVVEDYIGYNADPQKGDIYDFDFVDVEKVGDAGTPILKVGGKEFFTKKETAKEGATSSYSFSAEEGGEATFTLDYYKGNGTTEERFRWTFYQDVLYVAPASLTYRVKIKEKAEIPGEYIVHTNQSATLYPKDSLGNEGTPELFEIPELKYEVKGVDVKVTKDWNDESNRDKKRPDSIIVQLYADGEAQGEPVTLKSSNKWSYTWTKLRAVKNGTPIEYTVDELGVEELKNIGYNKEEIKGDIATGFTITNTYIPEKTSVSVNKVWNDADNQDGIRTEVTVQLKANGKDCGAPVTLSSDNEWKYTWSDLWKNEAGEKITYKVVENDVPGYEASIELAETGEADINYTITNTHIPEVIDIDVTKEWDDGENVDNIRPTEVTVQLYADGEEQGASVTLNTTNNFSHRWEELTKYKVGEEGQLVTYEVVETNVSDEYKATTKTEETADGYTVTITNTHKPFETEVKVTKVWNDKDNQDGIRPADIQVQLYADGATEGDPVTLSAGNKWTYTWTELPVNKKGENGIAIEYTVDELGADKLEQIGYIKEGITGDAENGFTITNTHTPAETQVTVTKVWEDAENQDNIRPTEIIVQLYAGEKAEGEAVTLNAANNWTYTWTELPVNAAGEEIAYTVKETKVTDGYTPATKVTGDAITGYTVTITNTHTPAVITVDVTKEWKDGENVDNIRPTEVTVQLYADGEEKGEPVTLNAANNWTHEWKELTKYRVGKVGELVVYEVEEVNVPENYEDTTVKAVTETTNSFTITNTHKPFKTEVKVTKVWDDDNNRDNVRPDEIQVQLYADGVAKGQPVTLRKDNWTHTWKNLPVNKKGENGENGIAIVYTVDELGTEELAEIGYTKEEIEGDAATGFTITNTREIDKTEVFVQKKWDDNNNKFKLRPDSIQVQLYKYNDKDQLVPVQNAVTLDATNDWKHTFTDLPVNEKGKEGVVIRYTVKEVKTPEFYESTLSGTAKDGFTITNKLLRTTLTLTKRIDQINQETATAIFRYLITGPDNYHANVTLNFESGTVKVGNDVQSTDNDLSDNIGFDKEGLTVTLENLPSGDYTITEYAARGYQLVQMAEEDKDAPKASATAINGVQNKLTVTTTVDNPAEVYYWNRYKAPNDYTAVNRFSVDADGNLGISIKRK